MAVPHSDALVFFGAMGEEYVQSLGHRWMSQNAIAQNGVGHLRLHHHLHRRNHFPCCMTEQGATENLSCFSVHNRLEQSIGLTQRFRSGNG